MVEIKLYKIIHYDVSETIKKTKENQLKQQKLKKDSFCLNNLSLERFTLVTGTQRHGIKQRLLF